jgi:hypothetical protein
MMLNTTIEQLLGNGASSRDLTPCVGLIHARTCVSSHSFDWHNDCFERVVKKNPY